MANLPPLITEEGLVLNNMMPDQGALGNYTPPGTASSEGISLLMRGVLRAAIATGAPDKRDFAHFLFNAACTYFFGGVRPTADNTQTWNHSWIANGGAAFSVRGPLQANGDLALSGYLYTRDPQSTVFFTNGVGQLTPPPDVIYQAVTSDSKFVWDNMFSDLTQGNRYQVEYYIDAVGNKVFGTQTGGSFGQPAIPAGEHSDGAPGKIVLTEPLNGNAGVNYAVTVPDVKVSYGELYEAWPMWRKLAQSEVSTAADAIHWFLDAFAMGMELEPDNVDWKNAHDRMMDIWRITCDQQSNSTIIFQAGSSGTYNNFPLTYSYAYGRDNIDNPNTNWTAVPPTTRYSVARTVDRFVSFDMPLNDATIGSAGSIRYGVAFENSPMYLDYTSDSSFSVDMQSNMIQTVSMSITDNAGVSYEASILIGPDSQPQLISPSQFLKFQNAPGDSDGTKTGDWDDDPGTLPEYDPVPFPGTRLAMIGDSITWYNTAYVKPDWSGLFENWGFGMNGYWTHCDQILNGRLVNEPAVSTDVSGYKHGLNFAIAGSRIVNAWLPLHDTLGDGVLNVGPMYAALNNITRFDCVLFMYGTNDLAGNLDASDTLWLIKKAVTDLASRGKWVYLLTITPRSRGELKGYPIAQIDVIRRRLETINQGLRDWTINNPEPPPNVFLVDPYTDLLGPNGMDPAGTLSSSVEGGLDTPGNFRPDFPNRIFMHDGLHPAPTGAYVIGKKLAEVIVASGVPVRPAENQLGTLNLGANLLPNPGMIFTSYKASKTNPLSFNLSSIGWATGLGPALRNGADQHIGFQYGKLPDCWNFWRSTNVDTETIGSGSGGTYSNFQDYMWGGFVGEYPVLAGYIKDSTWPIGSVLVNIGVYAGKPCLQIDFNIPITGNKNEAFVINTPIPRDQHGPWDNYGFDTPDQSTVRPNYVYLAGDTLVAESDVVFQGFDADLVIFDMALYTYGIEPNVTLGAVRQSFGNHPFFWPPSEMDRIRFPNNDRKTRVRAPAITIPTYQFTQTMRYAELKWQFSFDCSVKSARGTIIIQNPEVRKVINGIPL
jgi:lysophospholipase L1-like esterase